MKYFIKNSDINTPQAFEINQAMYQELIDARETLIKALSFEEKYDLLIENYMEFELEILKFSTIYAVQTGTNYMDRFIQRNKLNQRLANLLTSTRLYVDQTKKLFNGSEHQKIDHLFNDAYDTSIDYRFMESLRNHVQHKELPIHIITNSASYIEKNPENLNCITTIPSTLKSELINDKAFKKSTLSYLEEKIDLAEKTRGYIQKLNEIHLKIRSNNEETFQLSRNILKSAIENYNKTKNTNEDYLIAIHEDDQSNLIDKRTILLNWDDVRIQLTKKNGATGNLKRKVISNRNIEQID